MLAGPVREPAQVADAADAAVAAVGPARQPTPVAVARALAPVARALAQVPEDAMVVTVATRVAVVVTVAILVAVVVMVVMVVKAVAVAAAKTEAHNSGLTRSDLSPLSIRPIGRCGLRRFHGFLEHAVDRARKIRLAIGLARQPGGQSILPLAESGPAASSPAMARQSTHRQVKSSV
jgi:hypothetical protein